MVQSPPATCSACGRGGATYGRSPFKYCKRILCQGKGEELGHIIRRGKRARGNETSPDDSGEGEAVLAYAPTRGTLKKIERVFGVRSPPPPAPLAIRTPAMTHPAHACGPCIASIR